MTGKITLKMIIILLLVLIVSLGALSFLTGCKIETSFGELVICESLNQETFEPVNPKNEFEMSVSQVNATINLTNVKGTDSYRFIWKNSETNEIISDFTGVYNESEKGYLKGWFSTSIFIPDGGMYLAVPGEYTVEFFHNGELKSSAEFKIKEPAAKIMQAVLTDETNEFYEPSSARQVFSGNEKIFICLQTDFLVAGSKITAKWYNPEGQVMLETPLEISKSFYETSWVAFSFESAEKDPLAPGPYKVEIFYNEEKFNEYLFSIEETAEETGSSLFSQQNMFTEAEEEYRFVIGYPDGFTYTWSPESDGATLAFNPMDENVAYTLVMQIVLQNNEYYPDNDNELNSLMDELASAVGPEMSKTEAEISGKRLVDGTEYKEYIYYLTDEQEGEFGFISSAIFRLNRLYIFLGFTHETYYEEFNSAYYGSLAKLSFIE